MKSAFNKATKFLSDPEERYIAVTIAKGFAMGAAVYYGTLAIKCVSSGMHP